jgi:short-subunit dehydrogenase
MGPFKDLTPLEIEQTVTVNALHPIYLTKALLDRMLAREKRSGIIVMSSGLGSAPIPGVLTYSMSKSFSSYLAEGLNIELKHKIDCLSYQCGEVSTKLIGSKRGMSVVSTQTATKGGLRDLGTKALTYGCFIHDLQMSLVPSFIIQFAINAVSKKVLQRYREKQARELKKD